MAMELKQHLKLSQQLVMTPQLQQAIKLLQLSRMELLEQVREELEQNPLLEQPDESAESEMAEKGPGEASLEAETQETPVELGAAPTPDRAQEVKGDGEGPPEIDWEAYLNSYQFNEPTTPSNRGNVASDDLPSFEANLVRKEDLFEHIAHQLGMLKLNDAERRIAMLIIGNLDGDGYLKVPSDEGDPLIPLASEADVSMAVAERTLRKIQHLDPKGCGARDLQEAHEASREQEPAGDRQGAEDQPSRGGVCGQALEQARPQTRPQLLGGRRAVHHPGRLRLQAQRRVHRGPQRRWTFQAPDLGHVSKRPSQRQPGARAGQGVHPGQAAQRDVAHPLDPPAATDDLQGHRIDREIPARVPRRGDRLPQAADSSGRGGGHRNARVHRLAGDDEQIRPHPAGHLRAEILLQLVDFAGGGGGHRLGGGEEPHQATGGSRGRVQPLLRPEDRGALTLPGDRDRSPHRGKVPRGPQHPPEQQTQALLLTVVSAFPRCFPGEACLRSPSDRTPRWRRARMQLNITFRNLDATDALKHY